jgi:hypothetical protein
MKAKKRVPFGTGYWVMAAGSCYKNSRVLASTSQSQKLEASSQKLLLNKPDARANNKFPSPTFLCPWTVELAFNA